MSARSVLMRTVAAAAVLAITPALAQNAQRPAQTPTPTQAQAVPGTAQQSLQQAEQALRQALQQMQGAQGAQQQQAAQNVRQSLTQLQQAMNQLPAQQRTGQGFRTLEQRINDANAALQGTDMTRARASVDAVIVAIPVYRQEAGLGDGEPIGAQIVVRESSPTVQVQQAQPQITVQQGEPVINVVVPPPEIIVRQPPAQVTVQMPQPRVTVEQAQPQVRVVEAQQPQVQVQPAQPQVQVQAAQPRVQVQQQGQPTVRFEQQGQPIVRMEQQAQAQQATPPAGAAGRTTVDPMPRTTQAPVTPTPPLATTTPMVPPTGMAAGPVTAVPLARVSDLIGTNLIGAAGRDAGEIENFLIDRQGNVRGVVVQWGGFLGIGERSAVIPIEQIQFGAPGERARLELTREQLEQMEPFDRNNLNQYATRNGWGDGARLYR